MTDPCEIRFGGGRRIHQKVDTTLRAEPYMQGPGGGRVYILEEA